MNPTLRGPCRTFTGAVASSEDVLDHVSAAESDIQVCGARLYRASRHGGLETGNGGTVLPESQRPSQPVGILLPYPSEDASPGGRRPMKSDCWPRPNIHQPW